MVLGSSVEVDPRRLSVKQVRELLDSISTPQPELLSVLCGDPRVSVRRIAYRLLRRGGDMASNEEIFRDGEVRFLAGTDEAGRGALAGPIAAAAVMFAPGTIIEGVRDSKELLPDRREELYDKILSEAVSVTVSFIDSGLIDRWGIQMANLKALGDAVNGLDPMCQRVICDHFSLVGCSVPVFGIPQADATFQSVAAASIIAKVERDRVMRSLDARFPPYNFMGNKGYGTEEHLQALVEYGPCEVHRRTFRGVLPEEEEMSLWES